MPTTPPERRTRLGVMGGTFDPIHHGHLVAASEVQGWFDLDEVVFVPTGQPWQKADRVVSPAEHRYLMTVIATAANPRFTVSRVDIDRQGPTYTTDTLRDLHAQRPDADLYFITGADALTDIFSWRDVDELFELAHFVGCTRPGAEVDPATLAKIPHDRVTMVEIPALAISSTDCRERQRRGQPVWYLVPDGVVQYITKHGLYARPTPTEVEEVAQQPVAPVVEEVAQQPVAPVVEEVAQQPVAPVVEEVAQQPVAPVVEEVAQQPSRDPRPITDSPGEK